MATEKLPEGLVPSGSSLTFTEDTIPAALQKEHTLVAGRWGVLHVFAGSVRFVNLETSEESDVSAPDHVIIHPEATAQSTAHRAGTMPRGLLSRVGRRLHHAHAGQLCRR